MSGFGQYWKTFISEFRTAWRTSEQDVSRSEFRSAYKADVREQWEVEQAAADSDVVDLGDAFINPIYIDDDGTISHDAPDEVIDVDIDPVNADSDVVDLGDAFINPIYIDDDGTISHDAPNEVIEVDIDPVNGGSGGPKLIDGATTGNSSIYFYDDGTTTTVVHPITPSEGNETVTHGEIENVEKVLLSDLIPSTGVLDENIPESWNDDSEEVIDIF